MQYSDIPTKFNIPWANGAGGSYIRPIPQASQIGIQAGAASLTDGFPPLNFLPNASGGVPPFGQDTNGILNQITAWTRWQNAGAYTKYDGTFSTAVGGYPAGAVLLSSASNSVLWLNTVDNNTTNPDSGGSNWIKLSTDPSTQSGSQNWAGTFTGTNTLTATLSPVPASIPAGFQVWGIIANNPTGAMSLNVNGTGAKTIQIAGAAVAANQFVAGRVAGFEYDGTQFQAIAGFQVTNAGMAPMANQTLKGNASGAAAVPSDLATSAIRAMTGITLRGYLFGLILSNDGTTPNTVLDIASGETADDSATPTIMALASNFTKSLSGTWVAGTGANGLDTGTVSSVHTYHVFVIAKADGSSADILFSLSATAPTLPATYTLKRRIGSIIYNTSLGTGILPFVQDGDRFIWNHADGTTNDAGYNDLSFAPGGSPVSKTNLTCTLPAGIRVRGIFLAGLGINSSTYTYGNMYIYDGANATIKTQVGAGSDGGAGAASAQAEAVVEQWTDTSSRIAYSTGGQVTAGSSGIFNFINTMGWYDSRGK